MSETTNKEPRYVDDSTPSAETVKPRGRITMADLLGVLLMLAFVAPIATLVVCAIKGNNHMSEVAKQPELTMQQLSAYDGWEVNLSRGLAEPHEGVLCLVGPNGQRADVHIPSRYYNLRDPDGRWRVLFEGRKLDVVWLLECESKNEKENNERQAAAEKARIERAEKLERIRQGQSIESSVSK